MSALEELVREAMGSGVVCFTEKMAAGEINRFDRSVPITATFGDFPAEFLRYRTDLVDAVLAELGVQS